MVQTDATKVRLKVSPQVARIVEPGAPRDDQLSAAQGTLPLAGKDLLTVLFFLCNSKDLEIKRTAVKTVKELPTSVLLPLLKDETLHPHLVELLVRARLADSELMGAVMLHPALRLEALRHLARKGPKGVLESLAAQKDLLTKHPEIIQDIFSNPAAEPALKLTLGWKDPEQKNDAAAEVEEEEEDLMQAAEEVDAESLDEKAKEEGLSKYQIAMNLKVAEKIKMGLTGDKEWRSILLKDSNKLVQGAVMKNPRITDGEVVAVAKSKTASDELIRLILLNKDWVKMYEIKKALVVHPKTPAPKAMRFVPFLSMKDIKDLSRSRQVPTLIASAARKELEFRLKKQGG